MSGAHACLRAGLALVACTLAVAGCGGDDDKAGGGSGSTKIAVQETAGVPSAFVAFGIDKGFFREQRLELELEATQGGAATIPALVSQDIQVGGSNVVSLLLAAEKGLPIKAIAPGTSAAEAGGKDFGALLVAKGGDVEDAADLEGKTVAVNTLDNIADVVVKAALEKEGADVAKLKLTEVPFPEMAPALEGGDVDAAFSIEPFVTPALGKGAEVVSYSYVDTESEMQVGAYAVTQQFAQESPGAVKGFQAAVAKTAGYVTDNEPEFRDFLAKEAKIEPDLARRIVLPRWSEKLDESSLANTAKLMQRYGLTEQPVDAKKLIAP